MLSLNISQEHNQPLAGQIVAGIKQQIDGQYLLPGTKLPSIRKLAESCNVSRFTVVEAYDRLVAMVTYCHAAVPASIRWLYPPR